MKKLFLILIGAAALSFQACKSGTADKDEVIDDGMNTSETAIGSGSTRPSDRNQGQRTAEAHGTTLDDGLDTTNNEMGNKPIETGTTPGLNDNNQGQPNYKKEDKESKSR